MNWHDSVHIVFYYLTLLEKHASDYNVQFKLIFVMQIKFEYLALSAQGQLFNLICETINFKTKIRHTL